MADEAKSSPTISILVALIGVAGSIGVAWITTQTKFSRELRDSESDVARMKQDLEATERRLMERQKELDAKVAAVDEQVQKLNTRIAVAQELAEKLMKLGGGQFGGKKPPLP